MTQPSPEQPTEQKKTLPLGLILGLALVISLVINGWLLFGPDGDSNGTTSSAGQGERTFETPEAAVDYVVSHLAQGEFLAAGEACAGTSLGENIDFDATLEMYQAWVPQAGWLPDQYPFWSEANAINAASECSSSLITFALSIVTPDDFDYMVATHGADLEDFPEVFEPSVMSNVEVVRVDEATFEGSTFADRRAAQCEMFGGEECTDVFVLLEADGVHYGYAAELINYGDGWLFISPIRSSVGAAMNLSVFGPDPMEPADYEQMLEEAVEMLG